MIKISNCWATKGAIPQDCHEMIKIVSQKPVGFHEVVDFILVSARLFLYSYFSSKKTIVVSFRRSTYLLIFNHRNIICSQLRRFNRLYL